MYRISELASMVGLSRSAVLYYEKLKLLSGKRLSNGYRVYSDRDVQQVRLVQQLQSGGLTLAECKACLERRIDNSVIALRYEALEKEIKQKQHSLALLAGLLGKESPKSWHEALCEKAPDAYMDWLKIQGYNEKEALRVKWLSKNMNEHEQYMKDFLYIFDDLDYWGPGSQQETLKAFSCIPCAPRSILEIGCGKGNSTITLAEASQASIIAVDNEQTALDKLNAKIADKQLSNRVETLCVSMSELDFEAERFDVIWAEASIYIIGVNQGLSAWKPLLEKRGVLVFSDLVWITNNPSEEAKFFWKAEYPDMTTVDKRITTIKDAGYLLLDDFTISEAAWKNYYEPLKVRLNAVESHMRGPQVLSDIRHEIKQYENHLGEFGYHFFVVQKL